MLRFFVQWRNYWDLLLSFPFYAQVVWTPRHLCCFSLLSNWLQDSLPPHSDEHKPHLQLFHLRPFFSTTHNKKRRLLLLHLQVGSWMEEQSDRFFSSAHNKPQSANPRSSSPSLPPNARHLPPRMIVVDNERMSSTSSKKSPRKLVSSSGEKAVPRAALGLFPASFPSRPVLTHA